MRHCGATVLQCSSVSVYDGTVAARHPVRRCYNTATRPASQQIHAKPFKYCGTKMRKHMPKTRACERGRECSTGGCWASGGYMGGVSCAQQHDRYTTTQQRQLRRYTYDSSRVAGAALRAQGLQSINLQHRKHLEHRGHRQHVGHLGRPEHLENLVCVRIVLEIFCTESVWNVVVVVVRRLAFAFFCFCNF